MTAEVNIDSLSLTDDDDCKGETLMALAAACSQYMKTGANQYELSRLLTDPEIPALAVLRCAIIAVDHGFDDLATLLCFHMTYPDKMALYWHVHHYRQVEYLALRICRMLNFRQIMCIIELAYLTPQSISEIVWILEEKYGYMLSPCAA